MVKLRFKATADLPTYLFRKEGKYQGTYGGNPTVKLRGPLILRDGDIVKDATAMEAQMALLRYPENFSEVEAKKSKSPDTPQSEEES